MFQFPGFASNPYEFRVRYLHGTIRSATSPGVMPNAVTIRIVEGGFPHSEILGSKLVRSSPRLIAAYHVLHRLSAPRHPPNALKALDHSHDRCPPRPDPRIRSGLTLIRKTWPEPLGPSHYACRTHRIKGAVTPSLVAGRCPAYPICSLFTMSNPRRRALRPRANCSLTPDMSRERRRGSWWSQTGSNRRPHACKARALPTELWPHLGGPRGDADSAMDGGPGTTRTSDLTLIRGAL